MKILTGIIIAVIFYWGSVYADPLAEPQLTVIQVRPGDTVWTIATDQASARQDVREVVAAIRRLNQLDHNGRIQPGQLLKVPKASL